MKHPPVKCYSMMLLAAKRLNFGGAIRLYFAAKHIDADGSGTVHAQELRDYLSQYGVSRRTFDNWLHDALDLGIFERWHDDKHTFNLVSLARAAAILGVFHLDQTAVTIPAKKLFGKGWHIAAWKAYIKANHQGKRVSIEKLSKITGVPVSTVKLYNKQGDISRRKGIGVSNIPSDHLDGVREYTDHKAAFVFNNSVAWHIPSRNKVTDSTIQPVTHGRARNVKHALKNGRLRHLSKFAIIPVFQHDPGQVQAVRLFCDTAKQYKAARNQRRKDGDYSDLYELMKPNKYRVEVYAAS